MRSCVERLDERPRSSVKFCELRLSEKLGCGLNERLHERLGERLGEILCRRLNEMLDSNMLQASRRIQKSLNLSQLPSPDEGLVLLLISFI